jgi:molybdopterin-guanine dinucleotide biosynthesis protein A
MGKLPKTKRSLFRPAGRFIGVRLNVTGYILVGGASSRFGKDKALVELSGSPMCVRMSALLGAVFVPEVRLVGDPAKYGNLGLACTPDLWPGEGPLGGILTALRHAEEAKKADYNLIIGCDMPFLTKDWLIELLSRTCRSEAQVALAKSQQGFEPLCAVWRTEALATVEAQFKLGVRKVTDVMKHLNREILDESVWKRFDNAGRLFWNMNTAADYEEARRILEAERK